MPDPARGRHHPVAARLSRITPHLRAPGTRRRRTSYSLNRQNSADFLSAALFSPESSWADRGGYVSMSNPFKHSYRLPGFDEGDFVFKSLCAVRINVEP